MSSIHWERVPGKNAILLQVEGELDLVIAGELEQAVHECVGLGIDLLLIDLSRTQFIDSVGVRAVLTASWRTRLRGCRLAVVGPQGQVRRVFEALGLESVLSIYPSQEDAI